MHVPRLSCSSPSHAVALMVLVTAIVISLMFAFSVSPSAGTVDTRVARLPGMYFMNLLFRAWHLIIALLAQYWDIIVRPKTAGSYPLS